MKKLFFVYLLCTSLSLSAQRHPIDQRAYDQLREAVTTKEMMDAQSIAYDGWNQLMTVTMKALQGITEPVTYAALDQSQMAWERYRDAQFEAITRVYYAELQGTMWRPVAIAARAQLVKQRAETLMDIYLELAAQQEGVYENVMGTWLSNSAAYSPPLTIRDNLTLYRMEQDQMMELSFYFISDNCDGEKDDRQRMAMTIYEFGTDQALCYFIDMRDADKLDLYGAPGNNRAMSFSRK